MSVAPSFPAMKGATDRNTSQLGLTITAYSKASTTLEGEPYTTAVSDRKTHYNLERVTQKRIASAPIQHVHSLNACIHYYTYAGYLHKMNLNISYRTFVRLILG